MLYGERWLVEAWEGEVSLALGGGGGGREREGGGFGLGWAEPCLRTKERGERGTLCTQEAT